jgi:nucleotidyltransferase/DNA polymerase involved in DNA repair
MPHRPIGEREAEIARVLDILHRWGIHTLGQFAALDKEEVGTRLGPIGLQLWDRAKGKTTRLLKLISPPESFEEAFEFENEIETVEPLLFMLRRFLQQLSLRLGALYLVASELRLEITFSNKSAYSIILKSRNRPITAKCFFGCCTRIWRILHLTFRLLRLL